VVATTTEEILLRLALEDESVIQTALAMRPDATEAPWLHQKGWSIARLSALIALGATVVSYQSAVIDALAAGITADEIVGTLLAVAPLVGRTRVTSAAPAVALALGYDVDAAFERLNGSDD
jgi:alkylhydroperoxidase/carboxymuconolactone decarboxylase family protein YurZ